MRYLFVLLTVLFALAVSASSAVAVEGNFLVSCGYTQTGSFDPIGGAAHEHAFGGALGISPTATPYQMLTGGSACQVGGETPGVWHPTIVTPDGVHHHFDYFSIYYRNPDASTIKDMPFPFGLKNVNGDAHNTDQNKYAAVYRCYQEGVTRVFIPPSCPGGTGFEETMFFNSCWGGKTLDAPDHHTLQPCDAAHPIHLPAINLIIEWPASAVNGRLTSDIETGVAGGLTSHADYWYTINPFFFDKIVERCLNAGIQCRVAGQNENNPPGTIVNFSAPSPKPAVLSAAEAGAF